MAGPLVHELVWAQSALLGIKRSVAKDVFGTHSSQHPAARSAPLDAASPAARRGLAGRQRRRDGPVDALPPLTARWLFTYNKHFKNKHSALIIFIKNK